MHDFLAAHRDELARRCKEKVAQRPLRAATGEQLAHGIPMFLEQLIRTLVAERAGSVEVSARISGPSGGDDLIPSEMGASAAEHGLELLGLGYTVDQVVHDYGDLCQAAPSWPWSAKSPSRWTSSARSTGAWTTPSPARCRSSAPSGTARTRVGRRWPRTRGWASLSAQRSLDKMFMPFHQHSKDRSSLGLGLSIARQSIQADQGTLTVRNLPGTGCVFTVRLPCQVLQASRRADRQA